MAINVCIAQSTSPTTWHPYWSLLRLGLARAARRGSMQADGSAVPITSVEGFKPLSNARWQKQGTANAGRQGADAARRDQTWSLRRSQPSAVERGGAAVAWASQKTIPTSDSGDRETTTRGVFLRRLYQARVRGFEWQPHARRYGGSLW